MILLDFECGAGDAALANDRLQGTDSNLWMVWNGYGHRPKVAEPLHDDVASALPNNFENHVVQEYDRSLARRGCEAYPCAASNRVINTCV